MATDCLVTKFKSIVNNDNLEKLGELKVRFDVNAENVNIGIYTNLSVACSKAFMLGGTLIEANTPTVITGQPKSTESGRYYFYVAGKYALTQIEFLGNPSEKVDTIALKYCNSLTSINANNRSALKGKISNLPTSLKNLFVDGKQNIIEGDVSDLNRFQLTALTVSNDYISGDIGDLTLTTLAGVVVFNCKNVTGNVSSFAKNEGITTLYCNTSGITGTAENFAQAAITAGKSSGTVKLYLKAGGYRIVFSSGSYQITPIV